MLLLAPPRRLGVASGSILTHSYTSIPIFLSLSTKLRHAHTDQARSKAFSETPFRQRGYGTTENKAISPALFERPSQTFTKITPLLKSPKKYFNEDPDDGGSGADVISASMDRQIRLELLWIQSDPLKVANAVRRQVQIGNLMKAKRMVELCSRNMGKSYTVAWNHTIDGFMKDSQPTRAWKTYNDMKKRAQIPDSYTYTLLLRGFARLPDVTYGQATRALQIYQSLLRPGSKVSPLIIHANAALRACSRGRNWEGFWTIVHSLPEKGPMAPDQFTYSVIFQQLRTEMVEQWEKIRRLESRETQFNQKNRLESQSSSKFSELHQNLDRIVEQAKDVWKEIGKRSKASQLSVDEMVVCELSRVLLERRTPAAAMEVLDVMRTAIGLELQPKESKAETNLSLKQSSDVSTMGNPQSPDLAACTTSASFLPAEILPNRSKRPETYLFHPSNATLSVLLRATQFLRRKQAMLRIFGLLTRAESEGGYGVIADERNLSTLLFNIKHFRSSGDVVRVLEWDFPAAGVTPTAKHIQLAMEVCQDSSAKAKLAIGTATKVLDIGRKHGICSAKVLELYLLIDISQECKTGSSSLSSSSPLPPNSGNHPDLLKERLDRVVHEIADLVCKFQVKDKETVRWLKEGENEHELVRLFNVLRGKIQVFTRSQEGRDGGDEVTSNYTLPESFENSFSSLLPVDAFVPALMTMGGASLKDIQGRGQNALEMFCGLLDEKAKRQAGQLGQVRREG